eukprot:453150_1
MANKISEESKKYRELDTILNSSNALSLAFNSFSSYKLATNKFACTASKQWIHLLRSDRCSPTSNMLNTDPLMVNSHAVVSSLSHYYPHILFVFKCFGINK